VAVYYHLKAKGWTVLKRGWPTFMCLGDDGRLLAVYVKPRPGAGLGQHAPRIIKALRSQGIKVMVGAPDPDRQGIVLLYPAG